MYNDLTQELSTNFIEYAVAVNTDRSIPDAKSGLKPVAKRILYGAFDEGFSSAKPHVKCANIVGNVMADWHPHGDSSIYGALVRLSQDWVMRYPLIDFHGSNGNRDGDGPAAYRYTEARLAKITEDGLLNGIKKKNVDFIPNYSETKEEPITLPSIFPNLLCNPNSGIGVAIACSWACHNLREVSKAIHDYADGNEPSLPGPDFPTGGLIINGKELPEIIKTGHGSVKIRGKYKIEDNNIVFYEIPYGIATEELMNEIGLACDSEKITGIKNIRNESNRKGFRLVIECEKNTSISVVINKLFKETSLQTTFSYNQVALVDKTPTELGLKDCIKIYLEHNNECVRKETLFDLSKAKSKLEIIEGLLKALEDIDNIIELIKKSESAAKAKVALIDKYQFTENQATAIIDMKLGKLAGLEKIEIQNEKTELITEIDKLNSILADTQTEVLRRLDEIVKVYGDDRKTEITNLIENKEEKEIEFVEPEKCVVVLTDSGRIKRIPTSSFKTQKRNGKGVKTQDDITNMILRTNTVDSLMIFTNKGKMYRLLVNDIPVGTNASAGEFIHALIEMEPNEKPSVIYSIYRDTEAEYVLFTTKQGLIKKTKLDEFVQTKKKSGLIAITIKDGDELANVCLIKDEPILMITKLGYVIHYNSNEISMTSRTASGMKGIGLHENDEVITTLPIRDPKDSLAIFSESGLGKKLAVSDIPLQKRAGKGSIYYKVDKSTGNVMDAVLVNNEDNILICGDKNSICISAADIPALGKSATGSIIIKNNHIMSVSKV